MRPNIQGIGPRAWFLPILIAGLFAPSSVLGRAGDDPDADREAKAVARFVGLLEKTPRRGTSLDRVYGFHVERGTLGAFVDSQRASAEASKDNGASWMVVGLVESQRGHDSSAVEAFQKAEAARPNDPLASFYLGQSLVLVGQTDQAVEAFERALARKPARADAMEIYQALGRVHQRARRTEQALQVWERLEAQFPDDARVAEQIAVTLAEEGQPAMALPRYEKLATKARDPYRKIQFALEAADLKVRLGKKDDALADFEGILDTLNPDSWLHKEVRRKIDEVFLRNDDQAGLVAYYENWLKKHADDIDAMTRRARILANLGRAAEAREDLEKAVKLAPSRRDLRIALVDQFLTEKNFAEAARQYEDLAKADPNNPDNLREWGRLLLRDPTVPEADRKQAAAKVWNRLIEARPNDAAVAAQAADLFRKAEMTDEALALYRKAVALAAGEPQYREYLGEYLHSLKRGDEALAVWKTMADGPNRTAVNLGRLAEVLAGFGYKVEAESAAADAVSLDPKAFEWRLKHADLLARLDRHAEALKELAEAEKLADDAEQAEAVLTAEIKSLQADNTLDDRIQQLRKELEAGKSATADRYRKLARYEEEARRLPEATAAIAKAIELDPKSVPAYTTAARLAENSGNLGRAVEVLRKLAEIDRRARTEYFTAIARLEARLGRRDEALKAGRELLASAPNNPEHYQTFADLCFGLGENDEAIKALRRASQLNDTDPRSALTLAEALANQFRTEEAIEVYWRAFEKSTELDARIGVVAKLGPLYLQQNQFERLIARIERTFQEGDEQRQSREKAACLAQAYASAGDLPAARQQLESLLAVNPRDTQLLGQLVGLAESEGDFSAAARYQKQVLDAAPGFENSSKLAQLYLKSGELTEAEDLWAGMAGEEAESHRVLQAIDNLLMAGKHDLVESVTARLIARDPANWDALYREGFALASQARYAEAIRRFDAILALNLDDDQLAAIERAKRSASGGRPSTATATMSARNTVEQRNALARRQSGSPEILRTTGLNPRYGSSQGRVWTPADFGQARMAALGWSLTIAQRENQQDAFLKQRGDAAPTSIRAARDWYYLNVLRNDGVALYKAALNLARLTPNDPEAQYALLFTAGSRTQSSDANPILARTVATGPASQIDRTPPLPDAELQTLLAAFNTLRNREPRWLGTTAGGNLLIELKRAKRTDEMEAIDRELTVAADSAQSIQVAMLRAAERADVPGLIELTDRLERVATGRAAATAGDPSTVVNKAMLLLFDRGDRDQALKLLDHFLDAAARPGRVAHSQNSPFAANPASHIMNVQIQTGPMQYQQASLELPMFGSYYDVSTLGILRNAFELYRRGDLVSDLLAHLDDRKAKAQDDAIHPTIAVAYARWWNGDRDEAIEALTAAARLAPQNADLKLGVAEVLASRNEPTEALAMADSVEPTDQKLMQRRELLAMRLAVVTGDVDRARRAAERLFGLRLDANTQIKLAEQMHQLGQHELAEAVLGRARRRSSNDANALVALMLQYQRQNQTDQALQVAYQILRRSPRQNVNSPYAAVNPTDGAQQQALQVLMRSGKLEEQIARVEAQLEHAPGSLGLYQTLLTYRTAAGQHDEVKKLQDKILALRPDDANLRYQLAQQAYRTQDYAGSAEHYKAAILKDPGPFAQSYYMAIHAFRTAGKQAELADVIDQLDIHALIRVNPYNIGNFAEQLMSDPTTRDAGLDLFKRAFQAMPSMRSQMLMNLNDDELWGLPDVYDQLRETVVPQPALGEPSPWDVLAQNAGYGGNGQPQSIVTRLLDLAARQGRLDALDDELQAATDRWPAWSAGKIIRALIWLRQGQVEKARAQFQATIDNQDDPIPQSGAIAAILGQELEADPATQDLAVTFYRKSIDSPSDDNLTSVYDYSPTKHLVEFYKRAGKVDEARALIVSPRFLAIHPVNQDPDYTAYLKVQWALQGGQALVQLGFPADAVRLYRTVQHDPAATQAARFFGSADQVAMQLRNATEGAIRALQGDALARAVKTLASAEPARDRSGDRVDHVLLIQPRSFPQGSIVSLLDEALRAAAKAGPSPELSAARETLLGVAREAADDLTAQAAVVMAAAPARDPAAVDAALQALQAIVQKNPLEPLSNNARANQRQRREAERWLVLWPVVRHCARDESKAAILEVLADRAEEAARRQADPLWIQTLLRERGQMALDRGDRAAAEKIWGSLLDTILANPSDKAKTGPSAAMGMPASGASSIAVAIAPARVVSAVPLTRAVVAVPATPVLSVTTVSGSAMTLTMRTSNGGAGTTTDRFSAAVELAKLAAEKGMTALSLRAIRDGLKGGPPIAPVELDSNGSRGFVVVGTRIGSTDDPRSHQVESILAVIDRVWTRSQAPPADVVEALRDVVLPDARPREVFLYARSLEPSQPDPQPRSVGQVLVRWAKLAGQTDDLLKRIEARRAEPMAELPAWVLKVQIATALNDPKAIREGLDWLADRLRKDSLQTTAELACHAALPLLKDHESGEAAADVVDQAIESMLGPSGNAQIGTELALVMARRHFADGRADRAADLLQRFQSAREKPAGMNLGANTEQAAYLSKHAQALVAAEYARAGRLDDALTRLGQLCDAPPISNEPDVREALSAVALMLRRLPAAERYEKLKTWTLPVEGRKLARMLMTSLRTEGPPPPFPQDDTADPEGLIGTSGLLIQAAVEAKKLDELAQAAAQAQTEGAEHADVLLALIELEQGDPKPIAQAMANAAEKRKAAQREAEAEDPIVAATRGGQLDEAARKALGRQLPELLLTLAALKASGPDPALDEMARQAAETQLEDDPRIGPYQGRLAAALMKARSGGLPPSDPGLRHWRSWNATKSDDLSIGRWVVDGDRIQLAIGQDGTLTFAYPLVGRFAVRAEIPAAGSGQVGLAIHEAVLTPIVTTMGYQRPGRGIQALRPSIDLSALGLPGLQSLGFRSDPGKHHLDLALEFEPGKVRYVVDGRTVAEEAVGGTRWISLTGSQGAELRRVRIDGDPEIPREIRLIDGDNLDDWSGASVQRRPRRALKEAPVEDDDSFGFDYSENNDEASEPKYTWHASDGVLTAEPPESIDAPAGPRGRADSLTFGPPMAEGNVLSYEFFHEPGVSMVHPMLGRIAFLIEPEGVRLRWVPDRNADPESAGGSHSSERFTVVDPSVRREAVALKPNDWNAVKLTFQGGKVAVELNGSAIAERPIEPGTSPSFGFHLARDSEGAKIRDVVLRGDWPAKVPADLFEPREPTTPERHRQVIAWRGEKSIARDAADVLLATRKLPPAESHEKLAAWVLPGGDHPNVRLAWAVLPGEPGGTLEAPALDLIDVARKTNQLESLLQRLDAHQPAGEEARRDRAALRLLALTASGRPNDARADLTIVSAPRPDDDSRHPTPLPRRKAEIIAAAGLVRLGNRDALQAASALFDGIAATLKGSPQADPARAAREAQARIRGMLPPASPTDQAAEPLALQAIRLVSVRDRILRDGESSPPRVSARWLAGSQETAQSRGQGRPAAIWTERGGRIAHEPGHSVDRLYLAEPIRGDFEVSARLEGIGDDLIALSYAGVRLQIEADGTRARLIQPSRTSSPVPLKPAIDPKAGPVPFRMTVKDRICSFRIGDQLVGQATIARDAPPWLVLESNPRGRGAVLDLKISGGGEAPREVDLASGATLEHWYSFFDPSQSAGTAGWEKRGAEIVGERALSVIEPYEELLRFQRPVADGESIAYEFHHRPGKELVHPALDRMVFRIGQDGVKPSRVLGGAAEPGPDGKGAIDLKPDAWNEARLTVKGDRVRLAINGQDVYEGPIGPAGNRQFGLFHEAGGTETRVRGVRLIRP